MTQQTSPFLESNFGWALGESGWNTGADENWLQFSYLHDRNLDGIVSSLPAIVNGTAYFNTTDNRVYYAVAGSYQSSIVPKWFEFVLRGTGVPYIFNGSTLIVKPVDPASMAYTDAFKDSLANTGSNLGVSLVAGGARYVSTITALRASLVGISGTVFVSEVGRGGWFVTDPTVTVDNDITTFISSAGVKFRRVEKDSVNVMWAGAKCDGTTDDTIAVQKAVDYCATFTNWPDLVVPGKTKLTSSIVVNRLVDTTTSEWRVRGVGSAGGFHSTTAITMFTSTLPMTLDPQSEWICWENLTITCSDISLSAKVMSQHFLRQKFRNCYFSRIALVVATTYLQSFYFEHCNIGYWATPAFIFCDRIFDIKMVGVVSEFGASYLLNAANGIFSGSFVGGVHEGAIGGLISAGNIKALSISGYYFEYNATASLQFNASTPNNSIVVSGCWFAANSSNAANPAFFDIDWGNTVGAVSLSNYQYEGRLHGNAACDLDSKGDFARQGSNLLYANAKNVKNASGSWTPASPGGAVAVNSATYRREDKLVHVEFNITWPTSAVATPAIITGLPFPATAGIFGGVVAYTDRTGFVQICGGTVLAGGAAQFQAFKNLQGGAYTYAEMSSGGMHGSFTYAIA